MYSAFKKSTNLGEKRVTFAEGTKEEVTEKEEATSFFRPEKKPRFSAIRKLWFQYAEHNEYEQLKQYLISCTQKGVVIEDFFSQEGRLILSWAIRQSTAATLKFIAENVAHGIIQDVLTKNGHILEGFLLGQAGLDERNWTTLEQLKVRMEKFELLLKMGTQLLIEKSFSENKNFVSEKLISDFKVALEKYESSIKPELSSKLPTMK